MSATVTFLGEPGGELQTTASVDESLLEVALAAKVPIFQDCGGRARCTTCRVRVVDGLSHLSPRTDEEAEVARMQSWTDDIRLACQARTSGPLRIERMLRQGGQRDRPEEAVGWARSEERQVAVLFCDVTGFTEYASTRMPYDVVHVVNRLFHRIGEAVLANSGYIDKYLGDGLLALWGMGGGEPRENILDAIRAALLMQHLVRELSEHLRTQFATALSLRVGIHFGPVIIGSIGHPARRQLTAIGDTVNVASRVESQNKDLRTNLLITEECHAHVTDLVVVGDDFKTVLRGQSKPQRLYEITGLTQSDPIFLVQRQVHRVLLDGHLFVDRFYRHFFAAAPELQALFQNTDMPRQHEQFLNQLAWAVRELRHLPEFLETLGALGERHHFYGLRREHFTLAGGALLTALGETLGAEFDPEARAAWTLAFQSIANAMQERLPA